MSKREKKGLNWDDWGKFNAFLLKLFTLVRETAESMKVGIEIIPWLVGDGKSVFTEKFLKPLYCDWLEQQKKAVKIAKEISNEFLRRISGGETLIINACDGSEIIPGSDDMFQAGIDSDFVNWEADEPGQATSETEVEVHEMVKNGSFEQLFGSFGVDLDKLCFIQSQIKGFVKKHRKWLRSDGYGTFFLFKSKGKRFVADVRVLSGDGLCVRVFGLEDDYVWRAGVRHRLVVPKLADTK